MTCQNQFYRPISEYPNQEGYADTDMVKMGVKDTQLHRLVVAFRGVEMEVCEEV